IGGSLAALVRRHGEARASSLYRATVDAVEEAAALIAREQIDCALEMRGQLLIEGDRRRITREAELLRKLQQPGPLVDLPRRGRPFRLPAAGPRHPTKRLAALPARILESGGAVYERARVLRLQSGQPILDGTRLRVGQVIVCTNRARGRILPLHLQVLS